LRMPFRRSLYLPLDCQAASPFTPIRRRHYRHYMPNTNTNSTHYTTVDTLSPLRVPKFTVHTTH